MMATGAKVFAARIAQECAEAALNLSRLQDSLGDQIGAVEMNDLFVELQSLDSIQQTLDDLATVFAELAQSLSDDHPPVSNAVLAHIKQETLRTRLSGAAPPPPEPKVELF